MKRIAIKLVFLLLGAVVNIAVAWGCVLWSPMTGYGVRAVTESDRQQAQRYRAVIDAEYWDASRGLGYAGEVVDLRTKLTTSVQVLGLIRDWEAAGYPAQDHWSLPPFSQRYRAGWPMIALSGERWFLPLDSVQDYQSRPMPTKERIQLVSSIAIPDRFAHEIFDFGVGFPLPIRPSLGFLMNTVLYAAVLWLLLSAPFAARRLIRKQRGRCVRCGYDLRHAEHEVCPECGHSQASRPGR